MSVWNMQMQPPPVEVAARFSEKLGDAVREHHANANDEGQQGVHEALSELDPARVDRMIGERRARMGALLTELDCELRGLSQDLGFAKWRSQANSRYVPAVLNISRRRPASTVAASVLVADLGDIAWSTSGFVNADAPPRQLTAADFAGRGMTVAPYEVGAPGTESVDTTGRVRPVSAA